MLKEDVRIQSVVDPNRGNGPWADIEQLIHCDVSIDATYIVEQSFSL